MTDTVVTPHPRGTVHADTAREHAGGADGGPILDNGIGIAVENDFESTLELVGAVSCHSENSA